MKAWHAKLEQKLKDREDNNSLRKLEASFGEIDFWSNDYLGLARLPNNTISNYEHGSGGSRLIAGNSSLHELLEEELAQFHQGESALLFNSGFDANLALLSTLPQKGDTILYDELCHSSIRQGIRLSLAKSYKFQHNSIADLKKKIEKAEGQIFVVIESVYSMDGDIAPFNEIHELCIQNEAILILDEAHSNGVYGNLGEGMINYMENGATHLIRMMGLGKALGRHGGVVICSGTVKQYLINFAPSFIYTTAASKAHVESIREAYQLLQDKPKLNRQLTNNIAYFKDQIQKIEGYQESDSPIQVVVIPGNENVKQVSKALEEKSINCKAVLHPTVAQGQERLRICLHAFNNLTEIDLLVETLHTALNKLK